MFMGMIASVLEKIGLEMAPLSAFLKLRASRYMSRGFLYRRLGYGVIVILMTCGGLSEPSAAQDRPQLKRPNQDNSEPRPPEPKKKKKVKGPRAVGLLLLSDGKATLIPVAILVEGKFYDASIYKAEPVPMALQGGTVYEAEQAGESQGLFTVAGALHSQSAVSATPWMGTGSYFANGTEAAKTTRKAEDVPVGLDSSGSDEPPRLTRKSGATPSGSSGSNDSGGGGKESTEKSGASAPGAKGSAAGASGGDAGKGAGSAGDESDKKQSTTAEQKSSSGQTSAGQSSGQSSAGPPASGGAAQAQGSQGQQVQAQASDNYYRPTLRRGKPTQAAPVEEDTPVRIVAAGLPASTAAAANAKPVVVMTAISDAGGPQPESYKFFWKEGEEEERRKQMIALAGDEVRAYINARAKGAIGVKPPAASKAGVAKRRAAAKPVFENIQFRALDVWRTNQAVMILSADAHFPAEPGAASAPETYSITLVSRTDIYGSLRKLYSGVTDKFHLDVTPKLELIDGVDADGDGRGELLFRETSDAGKGYVIYRPTGDKLFRMFETLGAE